MWYIQYLYLSVNLLDIIKRSLRMNDYTFDDVPVKKSHKEKKRPAMAGIQSNTFVHIHYESAIPESRDHK